MRLIKDINSFSIGKKEINQYEISFFVFAEWKKGLQAATKINLCCMNLFLIFRQTLIKDNVFVDNGSDLIRLSIIIICQRYQSLPPFFASVAIDGESHHRRSHDFLINDSPFYVCSSIFMFFQSKRLNQKNFFEFDD